MALEKGAVGCVLVKDTNGAMDQTIADVIYVDRYLKRVLLAVLALQQGNGTGLHRWEGCSSMGSGGCRTENRAQ